MLRSPRVLSGPELTFGPEMVSMPLEDSMLLIADWSTLEGRR